MADAAIHGHEHHDERGFFTRWFMSTNHKDIGILYLFTGGIVGLISVIFTIYMRMELMNPGVQYMCVEGMRFVADAAQTCTPLKQALDTWGEISFNYASTDQSDYANTPALA